VSRGSGFVAIALASASVQRLLVEERLAGGHARATAAGREASARSP
jgi:hypothetical protein